MHRPTDRGFPVIHGNIIILAKFTNTRNKNKYAFDQIEVLHMTWAFCCQFIVEIHEWSSCCIFLSEQKLHVVDIFLRLSVNPRLV